MKKIIGIGFLVLMAACSSMFSPNQKIIMLDKPGILRSTDNYFYIGGHVQNISRQNIAFIEIVIYLRDSAGNLLSFGKTRIQKEILSPLEISSWDITFYDPDQSIRSRIDFSKLTYEINIKDSELPL